MENNSIVFGVLFILALSCTDKFTAQQIVRTPVADSEITALGETLWKLDVMNNVANLVTVNVQERATRDGIDNAPKPLLTVPASVYQKPTISKLIALHDNYVAATNISESVTPQESIEETAFLDAILNTPVMKKVEEFLIDKRFIINRSVGKNGRIEVNHKAFREAFRQIWFGLFSRQNNIIASSGFEHVFLGETRNGEVIGFHNWIFFAREEANRSLNYLGQFRVFRFGPKGLIVKNNFKWHGVLKPVTSMFVGTTPEFEMALYTLCYYTKPGGNCPITLNGKSVPVVTYFVNRQGKRYLSSGFVEL